MRKTPKGSAPRSVDDYLAAQPPDVRRALEKLRGTIRAACPGAEELISYQMPAFRYAGRNLVFYAGFKSHMSLFPGGPVPPQLRDAVAEFVTSKGTLQFTLARPIPAAVVRRLVKARMKQNEAKAGP